MNSYRKPSKFVEESYWIHWGILVNLLRNPSEFIEEFKWIHWGMREFIEESKWIHLGIWVHCWFQLNLFKSNESVGLKKILKWLKNSVLARRPITLVLVKNHFLKFAFWNSLFEIHFLKFTFWNSFFKFNFQNSLHVTHFLEFIFWNSLAEIHLLKSFWNSPF